MKIFVWIKNLLKKIFVNKTVKTSGQPETPGGKPGQPVG
jgi:hypothetical protein